MKPKKLNPFKYILSLCIAAMVLIPTFIIIYHYANGITLQWSNLFYGIIFSFFITALISVINYLTIKAIDKKHPWTGNKTKRFTIELLLTNFNAALVIALIVIALNLLFRRFDENETSLFASVVNNVVIAFVVNSIAVSIYEGINQFSNWKASLVEVEYLKREKAESQYAALKNQVNPHFLFNSLNSLSSLIRVSPDKAIEFVDKFSKIYRYVLEVDDKMVVELHEELTFLQSYLYLQQIRFGNNLSISTNIDAEYINDFILPLSIQMLIENAIKHNEISSDRPLKINIGIENNYLVISNNLQFKNNMDGTTGIGLKNLTERYKHFTDLKPQFYATNNEYIAKLPLLKENME